MISKMAMDDIEALRADGIDVPPREVIRLNALGLRVEKSSHSAEWWTLPRVAFLGDVALTEPTVGAEIWFSRAADTFKGDYETIGLLRVLSLMVHWSELPPAENMLAIRTALDRHIRRLNGVTFRQLENAISYCIDGALPESGEEAPPKSESGTSEDEEMQDGRISLAYGILNDGRKLRLGSAADLKDMTPAILRAIVDAIEARERSTSGAASASVSKRDNKALGDYLRARDALRLHRPVRKEERHGL